MIVILFGLTGAGKTFVGQQLSAISPFYFWDADEAITDEMKQCIAEKRSFTQEIRDEYFNLVTNHIKLLCNQHEHILVSQAFYKNKNRTQLLAEFTHCIFLQVTVDSSIVLNRLRERNNAITEEYAKIIINDFEPPTHPYFIITNNLENDCDSLTKQIIKIPELSVFFTNHSQKRRHYRSNMDCTLPVASWLCWNPLKLRSGSEQLSFSSNKKNQLFNDKCSIQMHDSGLKLQSGEFRFFSCEKLNKSDLSTKKERDNTYGFF